MTKSETYWKHEFQLFFVADAILFATPEHNYIVPAVLKNAIEWETGPRQTTPERASQRPSSALPPAHEADP